MTGWQGGSTRAWRKTRAMVLRRDRYRCQLRRPGCTLRADCVHHLDGKAAGDNPARLLASCQHCNLAIGDPTKTRGNGKANRASYDPPPSPRTRW